MSFFSSPNWNRSITSIDFLIDKKINDCIDFNLYTFFDLYLQAGESNGLFRKTISKLSTEYRIQFIWPHTRKERKRGDDEIDIPKKSLSMGAIKAAHSNAMPSVHKKRTIYEKEGAT